MSTRLALPTRRNNITQKVRIAGQRTLYISVHDDEYPAEVFLSVKGSDCSSELIGLYDAIARLSSLAPQHGAPTCERRRSPRRRQIYPMRLASGNTVLEAVNLNRPQNPGGQHDEQR